MYDKIKLSFSNPKLPFLFFSTVQSCFLFCYDFWDQTKNQYEHFWGIFFAVGPEKDDFKWMKKIKSHLNAKVPSTD